MSLITWRERNTDGNEIGPTYYIEFDATTLEEFTRAANVTIYPVEQGAVLSDHYQPQPRAITLVGTVTDTPVRVNSLKEGMSNAVPAPVGVTLAKQLDSASHAQRKEGIVQGPVISLPGQRLIRGNIERSRLPFPQFANVLQFDGGVTRVVDVFLKLDELMERRVPVSVIMLGEVEWKNMMITSHRAPRVSGLGNSLEFTLDLLEINQATAAPTTKPARKEPKHKQKSDGGKKNPQLATKKEETQTLQSYWYQFKLDGVRKLSLFPSP
ncbi:MAG: hypothetical protein OEU26_00140 [Candidatus Tectomicrobia bacterium]|nr:hypothetical protein [Candidatus Tectomicrobia bacterium]